MNTTEHTGGPNDEILLRIDPGTHSAPVAALLTRPGLGFALSIGRDKRIRRWEPWAPAALRTYVGQLGSGRDGEIMAGALHPDGGTVVVAVHRPIDRPDRPGTADDAETSGGPDDPVGPEGDTIVRVLDVRSGFGVMRTYRWHTDIVDLAFSSDGERVVVATSDRLDVYDSLQLLAADAPFIDRAPAPMLEVELPEKPRRIAVDQGGRIYIAATSSHPFVVEYNDGDDAAGVVARAFGASADVSAGNLHDVACSGGLVAVAGDGGVVVYRDDGAVADEVTGAGGGSPGRLAFSTDGGLLIVGSRAGRSSRVTVHRADSLELVGSRRYDGDADAVGFMGDGYSEVAVSSGGSRVSIHHWPADTFEVEEGADHFVDGVGQVIDAIGISGNEVGFGRPDPIVGRPAVDIGIDMDPESGGSLPIGRPIIEAEPGAPVVEGTLSHRFDLAALALGLSGSAVGDGPPIDTFTRAITSQGSRSLAISPADGNLILEPTGDPLTGHGRFAYDRPGSFGFLPSGRTVVGGQSGVIRTLRYEGETLLGRKLVGHIGRILDLACDDRWLVTAGLDQVIRLWFVPDAELESAEPDGDDGVLRPALNLFVTAHNEWVIWSHCGFYAASPKGDSYLTYHRNLGDEHPAQVYASDRFVKQLYRPEIIRRIFELGSEERALAAMEAEPVDLVSVLPPTVTVYNEPMSDTVDYEFDLHFEVAEGASPTTRIWVLHDGLPIWSTHPQNDGWRRHSYRQTVWLNDGPNRLRVLAENEVSKANGVELLVAVVPDEVPVLAGDLGDWHEVPDVAVDSDAASGADWDDSGIAAEVPDIIAEPAISIEEPMMDIHDLPPMVGGPVSVGGDFVWRLSKDDDGIDLTVSASRNGEDIVQAELAGTVAVDVSLTVPLQPGENHLTLSGADGERVHQLGTVDLWLEAADGDDEEPVETWHTVTAGQSLWVIAELYYGDSAKYAEIFEANRQTLADPDRLSVGQQLLIPHLPDLPPAGGGSEPPVAEPPPSDDPPPRDDPAPRDDPPPVDEAGGGGGLSVFSLPKQETPNPQAPGPINVPLEEPPPDPGPGIDVFNHGGVKVVDRTKQNQDDNRTDPVDPEDPEDGAGSIDERSKGSVDSGSGSDPVRTGPYRRIKPNLFILSIGVSDLATDGQGLIDLEWADDDAKTIADRFGRNEGGLFGEVWTKVLTDSEATRAGIENGLLELGRAVDRRATYKQEQNARAKDVTLLFFSGHGITRKGQGGEQDHFYLVPHDFDATDSLNTAVPIIQVGESLSSLPTELLIFVDACRSGGAGPDFVKRIQPEELAKRLHAISERTQYVLSSTSHDEDSWELKLLVPYHRVPGRRRVGHGLFTHAILKKLNETDGRSLGLLELLGSVQRQIVSWTDRDHWRHIRQRPMYRIYGDIPHLEIYKPQE